MFKLVNGEEVNVSSLYRFSKINLKKKRNKKKFDKQYTRYISKDIFDIYIGLQLTKPIINSFKRMSEFNLNIEPIENSPKGEIIYLDYKY